jgi:hypothetical protein
VSERWRTLLMLLDRGWAQLSEGERALFDAWLHNAQGVDLYTLLRYARRMWRKSGSVTAQNIQAVIDRAEEE